MKSFLKSQRKQRQSQNYHLKVHLKANGNYRNGSKNILIVGKNRGTLNWARVVEFLLSHSSASGCEADQKACFSNYRNSSAQWMSSLGYVGCLIKCQVEEDARQCNRKARDVRVTCLNLLCSEILQSSVISSFLLCTIVISQEQTVP